MNFGCWQLQESVRVDYVIRFPGISLPLLMYSMTWGSKTSYNGKDLQVNEETAADIYKPDMQSTNSTTYPSNVRRYVSVTGTLVTDKAQWRQWKHMSDRFRMFLRTQSTLIRWPGGEKMIGQVTRWLFYHGDRWKERQPKNADLKCKNFEKCGISSDSGDLSRIAMGAGVITGVTCLEWMLRYVVKALEPAL